MVAPLNAKGIKKELDPERIDILKSKSKEVF